MLSQGSGIFQAAPTYSAGISPGPVAVGDFDGDGIADVVITNVGGPLPPVGVNVSQGTVSILLGNGDGTFRAKVDYAVGLAPLDMALGDFNRDGFLDLVVVNGGGNLSVLLGNGDGTFRAAVDYPAGPIPEGVTVGDFNGDGIPDLAVANTGNQADGSAPGSVSIMLGNGDGTFQAGVDYASGGDGAAAIAVADFNHDGIPDLVVANSGSLNNHGQGGNVSVMLGNGDGSFQPAVNYTAGLSPFALTVADFNGDGIVDLAIAYLLSTDVSVLLGNGDGTFRVAGGYNVGPSAGGPSSVVAKDFNGDGILDLAVSFGGGVRVLLGNGDGTFQSSPISYLAGGAYGAHFVPSLDVGDFNGDGLPDLAVANSDSRNVSILINDGKWAP
jgi:hypothetical protein